MNDLSEPTINTENNNEYDIKYILENIDTSIANSLRRTMIGNLPIIAFDPENIKIHKNTSVLHNQFIIHRLSLIPLKITDNLDLILNSKWDNEIGERIYRTISSVPSFKLSVKNNNEFRNKYPDCVQEQNVLCVTSEMIEISSHQDELKDKSNYIAPDHKIKSLKENIEYKGILNKTSSFIILNKLKPNSNPESDGQELDIEFYPKIGTNENHSLYSPVGTVSYKMVVTKNLEKIKKAFNFKWLELNKERIEKNLEPLNTEVENEKWEDFLKLDSKRVVETDKLGNPNKFELRVESVGFLTSSQIFNSSVDYLMYSLLDITSSILFKDIGYELNNKKMTIIESATLMSSYDIAIYNENDTIGNLISSHLQRYFTGDDNFLNFTSYKKTHPLDKHIILRLQLNDHIPDQWFGKDKFLGRLKDTEDTPNEIYELLNDPQNPWYQKGTDMDPIKKNKILILLIVKHICYFIISIIKKLDLKNEGDFNYIKYSEDDIKKLNSVPSIENNLLFRIKNLK